MSDVARVEEYFTRSAGGFDSLYEAEHARPLQKWLNRTFRRDIYERFRLSLEHVGKYGLRTVLDVGCGPGRYEIGLAQIGVQKVVGIDVSPGMIQLAQQLCRKSGVTASSVEFLRQEFMNFQNRDGFDVVLAMGLFDYVPDAIPMLQRMRSFAKHSVIASFPSISWYRTPIRKMRYLAKGCPVYFYRRTVIDALAEAAGFARHEITKIEGAGQDYFVAFFN
jgi:2-polyprenyl-3-methyl-5-hydroxy-6-metoxy-1,4-benzoquinol methylase